MQEDNVAAHLESCSSPVAAEANVSPEKKRKVNKTSYENHSWITKTTDGYVCSVCQEFGIKGLHEKGKSKGTWVTTPLSLGQSRKLSDNASKHANSAAHQAAVAASQLMRGPGPLRQLVRASNEADVRDSHATKTLFRSAYLMFASEIAHTTHWRELVSTVAASDSSGRLTKFLTGCPANASHLSSSAVTSILEALLSDFCCISCVM